jgi:ribosomal subunit interface protein
MHISVTGHQIDVGDALRQRVEDDLADSVDKYFDQAMEGSVVFSREAQGIRVDISVHVGRGIMLQGHGQAENAHAAFDGALERIAKRLRRHKRRLRDHHRDRKASRIEDAWEAPQYILSGEGEGDDESDGTGADDADFEDDDDAAAAGAAEPAPVVIAEMTTRIESLTVGEAVMRMDLADQPALIFRNSSHGGLNVVYRRTDGNIGWVDPEGNPGADAG